MAKVKAEQPLQKAAMTFAKAWAKWHEHTGMMPDHEVIEAAAGILEVLGLEMEENKKGKIKLVKTARPA